MHKRQQLLAAAFFIIWTTILYAGADHPPPVSFLWLVLLCLIAALIVYVRFPTYGRWATERGRRRLVRVILEGAAAGIVFALIPILLPANGETFAQTTFASYLIWFAVLAVVGAANAILVYFAAFLFRRQDGSARDMN